MRPLELVWLRCGEKVLQREASVWTSITTFSDLHNFDEDKDFDISYIFLSISLSTYNSSFSWLFFKKRISLKRFLLFPIWGATALTASNKRFCWKEWNKVWQWSFISYTVFSLQELPVLVGVFKTSQRAAFKSKSFSWFSKPLPLWTLAFQYTSTFSWCLPDIAVANLSKHFKLVFQTVATTSETISQLSPISEAFTRRQDSRQQKVSTIRDND